MGGFFGDRAKWPSHCMTTLWLPPPIVAARGDGHGSSSGIDGGTGVGEVNIPSIEIRLNRNPQRRKDIKGVKWRERTVSVFYGKEVPVDHQFIDLGPQGSLKISGYTMNVNIEGLRARTVDVGGGWSNRRERERKRDRNRVRQMRQVERGTNPTCRNNALRVCCRYIVLRLQTAPLLINTMSSSFYCRRVGANCTRRRTALHRVVHFLCLILRFLIQCSQRVARGAGGGSW